MSPSPEQDFSGLAGELIALCNEAIEADTLDAVPNDALGGLYAAIVRLYAAKVQAGEPMRPFSGNSGVSVTDVTISCSALLDSVQLSVFELGAWQTFSGLGGGQQK
jgi:hypothetical protein